MKQVFSDVEAGMKNALDHLNHELKHLPTGRAALSMLDGVTVDYYGAPVPLNHAATLSVSDVGTIVAQPYDASQISTIERAVIKAGLGLTPNSDGKVVRIAVPALTPERRGEIVKKAQDAAENARNRVRQARVDGNEKLKKMEREKAISQDDERRGSEEVQKLHDRYMGEINTALLKKEQETLGN